MWNKAMCLGTGPQFGIPLADQIRLFRDAGFEGVFADYGQGMDVCEFARQTRENGLVFQSVHAPFTKMREVWHGDEDAAKAAVDELCDCLQLCIDHEVPIMVAHAFIGFEDHNPTPVGLERLSRLVRRAEGSGTRIAFENTEGLEYLDAIMNTFTDQKTVGFCWDTGHEMCYNYSMDMPQRYSGRLIATHLNDNLGISFADGHIFWTDDLHLLPYDGIADWDGIVQRLHREKFDGLLTFELTPLSKPNRHDNDKYAAMPLEQYIAEAYARGCRVANQLLKLEKRG